MAAKMVWTTTSTAGARRGSGKRKSAGYNFQKQGGRKKAKISPAQRGFVRTGGYYGGGAGELKFLDIDIDDAAVSAAGTIIEDACPVIVQGTGENERLGRKCTIKKIGWKFNITLGTSAAALSDETVRVILYLDTQCNGTAAAVTGTGGMLVSDDYQAFNNLENSGRFRTWMDRTYSLNSLAGGYSMNVNDTFYKDCSLDMEYSGTTGAIGEMRSNNFGVLLLSKGGQAVFDSKMRIRFVG